MQATDQIFVIGKINSLINYIIYISRLEDLIYAGTRWLVRNWAATRGPISMGVGNKMKTGADFVCARIAKVSWPQWLTQSPVRIATSSRARNIATKAPVGSLCAFRFHALRKPRLKVSAPHFYLWQLHSIWNGASTIYAKNSAR